MKELERARTLLSKGQREEALPLLVDAWRACRHPELAELVERLGAAVAAGRTIPTSKTWSALAAKRDPADLDGLLATIEDRAATRTLERLEALGWVDDPRLAKRFLAWIAQPPYTSESSRAFYRHLFARMVALGDLRLGEAAATMPARWDRKRFGSTFADKVIARGLAGVAAELGSRSAPALDAPTRAAVVALSRQLAPAKTRAQGPELLSAILANPDDESLRQVYADWLVEAGDPRGELIVLQSKVTLTRDEEKRVKALLKEHQTAWLGPLAKLVRKESVVFERGFLARCEVRQSHNGVVMDDAACELEEWATVREILCAESLAPTMRGLRRAHVLRPSDATTTPPLPIEELVCQAQVKTLARLRLPRLRRLILQDLVEPSELRPLWAEALGQGLEELLLLGSAAIVPALDELERHAPPNLRELRVKSHRSSRWELDTGWLVSLTRGRHVRVELEAGSSPEADERFVTAIASLPGVTIAIGRFPPDKADLRARIEPR